MMIRRKLLMTGAAAAAGTVAGLRVAHAGPARVRIRHHTVPWRVARPVRLVHITDIHVGCSTPEAALEAAVQAAHRARPHLTVLTGDYVNSSLHHEKSLSAFVRALPGPVVATLGNHDHWADGPGMHKLLRRAGATVLANQRLATQPAGVPLHIVGVDDARSGHDDVDRAFFRVSQPHDALVLSHDPASIGSIVQRGGRLVLSGHTHGGQVQVPGLTDALGRCVGQPHLGGWHEVGAAQLYVNAGLGHSRPGMRVGPGAAAEVSVLDLVPLSSGRGGEAAARVSVG